MFEYFLATTPFAPGASPSFALPTYSNRHEGIAFSNRVPSQPFSPFTLAFTRHRNPVYYKLHTHVSIYFLPSSSSEIARRAAFYYDTLGAGLSILRGHDEDLREKGWVFGEKDGGVVIVRYSYSIHLYWIYYIGMYNIYCTGYLYYPTYPYVMLGVNVEDVRTTRKLKV